MNHSKYLATLSLLGLAACIAPAPPPVEVSLILAAEYRQVNPADVAVLQVEDRTGKALVKPLLGPMREQLRKSLVDRNYSPLGSVFVDGRMRRGIQNASLSNRASIDPEYLTSLAGQAGEDAILAVQVSHWDESSLLVSNQVRFAAKVTLYGSAGKIVLASGDIRGLVIAGGKDAAPRDPAERARSAAREFAKVVISKLPKRQA